ncbi:aspartate ammonia-lyase [Alginatibacterium sediminis]
MNSSPTPQFRQEEDLLGSLDIPVDAYYGVHTQRAINNFDISTQTISDFPEFILGMVITKKAAALANGELGTVPDDVAKAIVAACDYIFENRSHLDQFKIDVFQGGAGTSVNMNTNEVIANVALELMGEAKGNYDIISPNDHVNKSQSTNDAYPTGFRVASFYYINQLLEDVELLSDAFFKKSDAFKDVLKMGRTQLQDAVPMTLGQEFRAFAVTIKEELKSIRMAQSLLLEVNLGATAIGTGLNTHQGYSNLAIGKLAEITKWPFVPAEDLVEATSDCGAYVMLSGALKRCAVKLSKVCNDLRLLSSGPRAGFNEINLPEMQAGSSIMPAKVNPVIPEVVNQVCFKVCGNDLTIAMAAEAGQLQLNVMEPVIAQSLFESIHLLEKACVALKEKCVDGITANADVCMSYVENSIGLVTFLNPFIGHHNGDKVGRICAQSGKTVREVVLELQLLSEDEIDKILSVENLKNPKYTAKLFK